MVLLLIPGDGLQVYENIQQFNRTAGFGVMLVDTPSDSNCVTLDDAGNPVLQYALSDSDKSRFRTGVAIAIRMMFLAGAKKVIIPSNENFLKKPDFEPMHGVYLTKIEEADLVEQNLEFIPNRTLLTSAHLQATNKIGPTPDVAVVFNAAASLERIDARGDPQSLRDGQQHLPDLGRRQSDAIDLHLRADLLAAIPQRDGSRRTGRHEGGSQLRVAFAPARSSRTPGMTHGSCDRLPRGR